MISLPVESFTLAWMHSIEKVRWEEDYRVDGKQLLAPAARVKGSAAGMEPPANAMLKNGWWHYRPTIRVHDELRLTRSPFAQDYEICSNGRCKSLGEIAPQAEGVTRLLACAAVLSANQSTGSPPYEEKANSRTGEASASILTGKPRQR